MASALVDSHHGVILDFRKFEGEEGNSFEKGKEGLAQEVYRKRLETIRALLPGNGIFVTKSQYQMDERERSALMFYLKLGFDFISSRLAGMRQELIHRAQQSPVPVSDLQTVLNHSDADGLVLREELFGRSEVRNLNESETLRAVDLDLVYRFTEGNLRLAFYQITVYEGEVLVVVTNAEDAVVGYATLGIKPGAKVSLLFHIFEEYGSRGYGQQLPDALLKATDVIAGVPTQVWGFPIRNLSQDVRDQAVERSTLLFLAKNGFRPERPTALQQRLFEKIQRGESYGAELMPLTESVFVKYRAEARENPNDFGVSSALPRSAKPAPDEIAGHGEIRGVEEDEIGKIPRDVLMEGDIKDKMISFLALNTFFYRRSVAFSIAFGLSAVAAIYFTVVGNRYLMTMAGIDVKGNLNIQDLPGNLNKGLFFVTLVLEPTLEEIMFRAGIYEFLRLKWKQSSFTANLIQAFLFSLVHLGTMVIVTSLNPMMLPLYTFLGFILGKVYQKAGLFGSTTTHIIFNMLQFITAWRGDVGFWGFVVSAGIMNLIFWGMVAVTTKPVSIPGGAVETKHRSEARTPKVTDPLKLLKGLSPSSDGAVLRRPSAGGESKNEAQPDRSEMRTEIEIPENEIPEDIKWFFDWAERQKPKQKFYVMGGAMRVLALRYLLKDDPDPALQTFLSDLDHEDYDVWFEDARTQAVDSSVYEQFMTDLRDRDLEKTVSRLDPHLQQLYSTTAPVFNFGHFCWRKTTADTS